MERKPCARIRPDEAGLCLLDWLTRRFTYLSADEWRRMILEGRVSLNDGPAFEGNVLAIGDTMRFDPPRYEEPPVDDRIVVAYEDEDYLIVEKSGSLPCHPGGRFFEHTLWRILLDRCDEVHIATRLDRETSGLVLVCKSAAAASYVQRLQIRGELTKEYIALVHGRFPDSLDADGFMMADGESIIRKKRLYRPAGEQANDVASAKEPAFTHFARESFLPSEKGDFCLLRVFPRTGRTHQIRATLLALGYPIVGDKLYGLDEGIFLRFAKAALDEKDLTRLILPNQALHCAKLSFASKSGKRIEASSAPPFDISKL